MIGLLIIVLGVVMLAANLGWFDARGLLRLLWPLVLVGLGVGMVRSAPDRRTHGWGWVLILLGLWLFLGQLGWIRLSLSQVLLPGVLLFVGASMVLRSMSGPAASRPSPRADDLPPASGAAGPSGPDAGPASQAHARPDAEFSYRPGDSRNAEGWQDHWQASPRAGQAGQRSSHTEPQPPGEVLKCLSVLSMSELRPASAGFSGANLNAVLGGIRLDLSAVEPSGGTVTVEIFALLGQVQILVPPHWVVRSQVGALLAAHALRRHSPDTATAPTLILKGVVVMGRLDVTDSPA